MQYGKNAYDMSGHWDLTYLLDQTIVQGIRISNFTGNADRYRMGTAYVGYRGLRMGLNSESMIRGPIQNGSHDLFNYLDTLSGGAGTSNGHFKVLKNNESVYVGYVTDNRYWLY